MGPVLDDTTRQHIVGLLGEVPVDRSETAAASRDRHTATWRPKASAQALRQVERDRALVLHGDLVPAIVRLRHWWEDGELRRRAESP